MDKLKINYLILEKLIKTIKVVNMSDDDRTRVEIMMESLQIIEKSCELVREDMETYSNDIMMGQVNEICDYISSARRNLRLMGKILYHSSGVESLEEYE